MADRKVRATGKKDGHITSLCNSGQSWSPRSKSNAIADINGGDHTYYVDEAGFRTEVHVVTINGVQYLRTVADKTHQNNLDNLPDC